MQRSLDRFKLLCAQLSAVAADSTVYQAADSIPLIISTPCQQAPTTALTDFAHFFDRIIVPIQSYRLVTHLFACILALMISGL